MKLAIEIANHTSFSVNERVVRDVISQIASGEGLLRGVVSVVFLTPREMNRISKTFHHKDTVPNVLSFGQKEQGIWYAGEIFLCPFAIRAEAKKNGVPFHEHMMELLVHGTLHLIGYTHARSSHAARMEAREERWNNRFHSKIVVQ